jgi:DNA-binding transcriptional ArsR family regulator
MMNLPQIEKISKALADETRLMIFEAIAARSI